MRVEDQYMDVLQNIEFAIVRAYRIDPDLCDGDVMRVLEALANAYTAEKIGRPPRAYVPSESEKLVLNNAHHMCEWRLGRCTLGTHPDPGLIQKPNTIDEILLCLKRLVRSVRKWNRHFGSRGYLDFVRQYVK